MSRTNVVSTGLVDPVAVAYTRLSTNVDTPAKPVREGLCLRCGQAGDVIATRQVVSARFTDWDRQQPATLVADEHVGWCRACAWAYLCKENRTRALWITPTNATVVSPPELKERLVEPVPADVAVSVPVGRRKHVLPHAGWGVVTTDTGAIAWGRAHANVLRLVRQVRDAGVSVTELDGAAPPFRVAVQPDAGWLVDVWPQIVAVHGTPEFVLSQWLTRAWKDAGRG